MAGLNCRVTVGLLGVLLLGAARLARGWGECGAASARSAEGALGFEGLHRPPRWGAGGTDGWGPPEARLRGVPRREWWPYPPAFRATSPRTQTTASGGVPERGAPRWSGPRAGRRQRRREGRADAGPGEPR